MQIFLRRLAIVCLTFLWSVGCQDKEQVFPSKSSTKSSAAARKAVAPKDSLANPMADGATTNNTKFVPVKPDGKGTYSEPWEVDGGLVTIVGLVPADKLVQMLPGLFRVTVPGFYSTYFFRAGFYCDRKTPATPRPVTATAGNGTNDDPYQLAEFVVHGNVPRTHYTDYGGGFYYFKAGTYANPNLIPGAGSPTTSAYPAGYYKIKTVLKITDIFNNLKDPCLRAIVNASKANLMATVLLKKFETLFGPNKNHISVEFSEDPNLKDENGVPIAGETRGAKFHPGGWTYPIILNPSILVNNDVVDMYTSKEFIASVVYHEIAHALIMEYGQQLVVSHEAMFKNSVSTIRDALVASYGMSSYDATALALGGLDKVLQDKNTHQYLPEYAAFAKAQYGIDLLEAEKIRDAYQFMTNGKGSRCP